MCGSYSCVEGTFTCESYSLVEGTFTCGSYSHVEGTFTCGSYSHVEGTFTCGSYSLTCGCFAHVHMVINVQLPSTVINMQGSIHVWGRHSCTATIHSTNINVATIQLLCT